MSNPLTTSRLGYYIIATSSALVQHVTAVRVIFGGEMEAQGDRHSCAITPRAEPTIHHLPSSLHLTLIQTRTYIALISIPEADQSRVEWDLTIGGGQLSQAGRQAGRQADRQADRQPPGSWLKHYPLGAAWGASGPGRYIFTGQSRCSPPARSTRQSHSDRHHTDRHHTDRHHTGTA
jgi:hypothetical protein